MTNPGTLKVTTCGDREIVMTRVFDAPRTLVWNAFTTPDLLKQWLIGPPGWTMVVCDVALNVGGKYRYVWRDTGGNEMGMGGIFREIVPPERIVTTEKFDQPWYPGEAVGTVALVEQDGKTTLTQTITYESRATRDAVLKSPMEQGLGASYDRLAKLLSPDHE
jgi:uncharacterized protein YndB with AHSA1/START domain